MQNNDQQIQDLLKRIEQLNHQNLAIKNTIRLLNDEVNELAFKINNTDAHLDSIEEKEEPIPAPFVSEVKRTETPIKRQFKVNSQDYFKSFDAESAKNRPPQYKT